MACNRSELPVRWPGRRPHVRRLPRDRHPHAVRRLSGGAQEWERRRRDLHRGAVPWHRDHHRRGAELIQRPAAALLVLLATAAPSISTAQGKRDVDRYDATFRKYSKRYFGVGYDWRIFKAQAMAESEMNPNARSWVGARGLMQLMPSTYKEIQSRSATFGSIDDPEWNI